MADEGRTAEFVNGSESVRQPEFSTVQQQPRLGYQRMSLLDNLYPTGATNGRAGFDTERSVLGVNRSPNGQSRGNYDTSLWLRPYKTPDLYRDFG